MARPTKYNWDAIKEAYCGGLDRSDILRKFRVDTKTLSNKINTEKWVVTGEIKAELDGFYEHSHKTAQNIEKLLPEVQELVVMKINTMEQDNELISNNRKLAKMLQGVIVSSRNEINLNNIKNVSGVLKDIESIANPTVKTEINNTNATQNIVSEIRITDA
jgi:hypothetical protein